MQSCPVCGRSFDPLGFQVVVPELGRGFDRIECAQSARAAAGPAARIAATPLIAAADPLTAAALAPAAAAAVPRALTPSAATFSLLAAGTAVAVVLWARILGADTTSFSLGPFSPPPAFGHETVKGEVVPPRSQDRSARPPESGTGATVRTVVAAAGVRALSPTPLVLTRSLPVSRSASSRSALRQLTAGPTKSTGKGHAKRGKGHEKHSTAPGSGHGNSNGGDAPKADHGKSAGKGKGKH
jgi:hypothetical protein